MSYYEIRQAGHPEAYDYFDFSGDAGDRLAAQDDALGRALRMAELLSRQRQRCWTVSFVDTDVKPPEVHELTRYGSAYEPIPPVQPDQP